MITHINGGLYTTDEAAPCPFCAYRGIFSIRWANVAWVECPTCFANGPITSRLDGDPLRRALDLWNEAAKEEIA